MASLCRLQNRAAQADRHAGLCGLFAFGRKIVNMPSSGRKEQIQKTYSMPL
jgi:hypothetical protein